MKNLRLKGLKRKNWNITWTSIQTLWYYPWNFTQVPPISLDHLWDVSPPWLETTSGKLNWLDRVWKGTHLFIKGFTADNVYQSKNQTMRLKELPAELRYRIVEVQIWERLQKNSAALKIPKSTVASIILTWKKFGTIRTLPRAGCPVKLSNQGRKALVREVTKNLMVTLAELQRSCVEIGETSRRTTITAMLHRPGLYGRVEDGSLSSVKDTWKPAWS